VENVTSMSSRMYKVLVGKSERKIHFENPNMVRNIILKRILEEVDCAG
jgi:hypothetical protein